MFKISYSPNLKGEVTISGSKNAALPIIAANYLINNKIQLNNKPNISDVKKWTKEQLADVIESFEIYNEDNIYINYKYDIMEYV